jgi:DNA-binding MarR family transcriptional regulator
MTDGEGLPVDAVVAAATFREALRAFLRQSEQVARRAGLTPQRHLLLLMIKGAPDRSEQMTLTHLAQRLQLAQSTVSELVERAEEAGLVQRHHDGDDGRIALVRLTAEGERRLALSFTDLDTKRRWLSEAINQLGPTRDQR